MSEVIQQFKNTEDGEDHLGIQLDVILDNIDHPRVCKNKASPGYSHLNIVIRTKYKSILSKLQRGDETLEQCLERLIQQEVEATMFGDSS